MSDPDNNLDLERRIDEICDEFERELLEGKQPGIDGYLRRVSAADRPRLALELLRMAVEYAGPRSVSVAGHTTVPLSQSASDIPPPDRATQRTPIGDNRDSNGIPRIGDYELLEELGSGGMGVVYRARQVSVNRIVAVKLLRPDHWRGLSADQRNRAVERFVVESQAAARRDHPNILTVYDAGCEAGAYFLAMKFVDGGSLADRVKAGPLEDRQAAIVMEAVCRALHAMHGASIIHRDLKPSNILVDTENGQPLVSDFGLAKFFDSEYDLTQSGEVFGTPSYMSPEQIISAGQVTAATDVYGIGATLYHLLTGRPPFQASTIAGVVHQVLTNEPVAPHLLNPTVSRDMETIALKCLEKEPRRRYADAMEVARELQRHLAGQSIAARPARWYGVAYRWCRRHRTVAALVGLLLTTMACATIAVSILYARERAARQKSSDLLAESYRRYADIDHSTRRTAVLPFLAAAHAHDLASDRELASRIRLGTYLDACPELAGVMVHRTTISAVAFNHRANCLATASDDGEVNVWSIGAIASPLATFNHGSAIKQLVFDPTDKSLAIACSDGNVWIYSVADWLAAPKHLKHPGHVSRVAFSSNDNVIATAGSDNAVRVWNTHELSQPKLLLKHETPIVGAEFSPAGDRLISACADGRVFLWSSENGERLAASRTFRGRVCRAEFHPSGQLIFIAATSGQAAMYDLNFDEVQSVQDPAEGKLVDAIASRNGQHVVLVGSTSSRVRTLSDSDSRTLVIPDATNGVVQVSADSRYVAIGTDYHAVDLWAVEAPPRHLTTFVDSGVVREIVFGADSSLLVTVVGQVARLWRIKEDERAVDLGVGMLTTVRFAPDGSLGLAVGANQQIASFGIDGGHLRPIGNPDSSATVACMDAGGRTWVWADRDGHVWACASESSELSEIDATDIAPICGVALSPNQDRIAIAGQSGVIRVHRLDGPCDQLSSLDVGFRPRTVDFIGGVDRLLITGFEQACVTAVDGKSPLTDLFSGKVIAAAANQDKVAAFAFSDKTWGVFDLRTGSPTIRGQSLEGPLSSVQVSRDGRIIAGATREGTVVLWSAVRRPVVRARLPHLAQIEASCFCHQGRVLATAGQGVVRLWDTAHGDLIARRDISSAPVLACHYDQGSQTFTTVHANGTLCSCSFPVDSRSVDVLTQEAQLRSGRKLDSAGELEAIAPHELVNAWRAMHKQNQP